MRLVREADLQSDYRERRIRLHQLAAGRFDAQLSHILPHGTALVLPELAGQVNRVNPNPACNHAEAHGLVTMCMKSLARASQPNRAVSVPIDPLLADETSGDLQHQAFNREGTRQLPQPAFLVKPHRKPRYVRIVKTAGLTW